ncbi:hypothetical protein [Candidatus Viadribacter manganicus]|uniref:Rap1a immunity protein domain-containing protein n=1 Tax=Candidatus Viadribacter manganicus TaxID=1759059 RepID=A0A1B1AH18_9PROT|nr:hypothetical protein [Candidatus Viadribacter manganicus]ANP45854.1 hypothetical protein ATE48_07900 [Candidatus Viadribacter manganicus]
MRFVIGGLIAAALVAVSHTGSASEAPAPERYLAEVIETCIEDGLSQDVCACFSGRLTTDLTYTDFQAMNQAVRNEQLHTSMAPVARIMDSCNPPVTTPAAPITPGYTASYVVNFMSDCVAAPTDVGYCGCAVSAIQRVMSFEEAVAYDRLESWGRTSEHPKHIDIISAWFACADQTRAERSPIKRR